MTPDWAAIGRALRLSDSACIDGEPRPLSGETWRADSDAGPLFIKTAPRSANDRLAAEALGLRELAAADIVRVPKVFAHGESERHAYLVTEWLQLGPAGRETDRRFGAQLAALHRVTASQHGWHQDNTIGLTPQQNDWLPSWVTFFAERRVRFQLELAVGNGFRSLEALGERLLAALPDLLRGHEPQPSLLHGDLWGGNYAACQGEPVIYDPAVYFGDRETDLAMTALFGGFSRAFYEAYQDAWPLPRGHELRRGLYQLYHVLNHVNLFGRGYLGQAIALMERALDHRA